MSSFFSEFFEDVKGFFEPVTKRVRAGATKIKTYFGKKEVVKDQDMPEDIYNILKNAQNGTQPTTDDQDELQTSVPNKKDELQIPVTGTQIFSIDGEKKIHLLEAILADLEKSHNQLSPHIIENAVKYSEKEDLGFKKITPETKDKVRNFCIGEKTTTVEKKDSNKTTTTKKKKNNKKSEENIKSQVKEKIYIEEVDKKDGTFSFKIPPEARNILIIVPRKDDKGLLLTNEHDLIIIDGEGKTYLAMSDNKNTKTQLDNDFIKSLKTNKSASKVIGLQ